ncbi:MAG: arginine--tRNA ligase [Parcubacteria bacterium C7867-004]|nr:MAG: arginine--tRNA ligase [Parcubacteria bacterium C7867-004]
MEETLRASVKEALISLGAGEVDFAIEWPATLANGDFATNAALASAKVLGRSPRDIADELASMLKDSLGELVSTVEAAGPGFVNITLARAVVTKQIASAADGGANWGLGTANAGQRIMVEYGNPNPFKEMHIGHLMGAVIGESISRLIEASGATVLRDTFGGDVGPQVAKALWALRLDGVTEPASAQEIGKAYMQGSNAYEESEEAKAEIDALNVRIYDVVGKQDDPAGLSEEDRALLHLWQRGREVSMEEFNRIFGLLGTRFDYTFFDSDTTKPGLEAVASAVEKGILEESEGAIVYKGEKKGLHTLVFVTSRGTPTYETKDLGLAYLKEMRAETDSVIIITAVEQIGHFNVVLAALEDIAPVLGKKTSHLAHGLLQLTTGKMSSRKGNVITASELIQELLTVTAARNADPLVAEQVAIGALKYMILRAAPGSNVAFDPEKSLSLEGDSGPYLQYALVRAKSVIAQSEMKPDTSDAPEAAFELERLLMRYPETVRRAEAFRAPHTVVQYLTQLAGEWNSFYANERIRGGEYEGYKLALAAAFVTTMENGLTLLGIPVPEKM